MKVEIGFKDLRQTVIMLGKHSEATFKEGDILVIGGIRIKEWQRERTLESTFLTIVERHPSQRAGLAILADIGDLEANTRRRKILRLSLPDTARIQDVLSWSDDLLRRAPTSEVKEFVLVGKLSKFTQAFFDADPPLVGDAPKEKLCWQTELTDDTGVCAVKVWDKPCYDLFRLTASGLRVKWEEGHETESKQDAILQELNDTLDGDVRCVCKLSVWSFGSLNEKHQVQINVNYIDEPAL